MSEFEIINAIKKILQDYSSDPEKELDAHIISSSYGNNSNEYEFIIGGHRMIILYKDGEITFPYCTLPSYIQARIRYHITPKTQKIYGGDDGSSL